MQDSWMQAAGRDEALSTHGQAHKPGDLVYLKEKTRKKQVCLKLMPRWKGPFMVVRKFGTTYEVLVTPKTSKVYHFDLPKPCHSRDCPPWIERPRK